MLDVLQAKRLPYFMSPRKPPEKCLQKTMSSKTVSSEKYRAKNHRVIFYIFDSINFFWNQTDTDRQLKFSKGAGKIGLENFIFHRNLCHNWQYFELRVIQRFDLNDICEWTYFFLLFSSDENILASQRILLWWKNMRTKLNSQVMLKYPLIRV